MRHLRIGATLKSTLASLARAAVLHAGGNGAATKEQVTAAANAISEAYNLCPSLDVLVPALIEGGVPAGAPQHALLLLRMRPLASALHMLLPRTLWLRSGWPCCLLFSAT